MSDTESSASSLSISTIAAAPEPSIRSDPEKWSRGERKARKLISQGNHKSLEDVSRVVFRQTDGNFYVIEKPMVFKNPKLDTYIVFGSMNYNDTRISQWQTAKDALEQRINSAPAKPLENIQAENSVNEEEEEDAMDEAGLTNLDIDLVMSQAGVSRQEAIKALRSNGNDIVNAIMELTK